VIMAKKLHKNNERHQTDLISENPNQDDYKHSYTKCKGQKQKVKTWKTSRKGKRHITCRIAKVRDTANV
jgi:hypothetical protein